MDHFCAFHHPFLLIWNYSVAISALFQLSWNHPLPVVPSASSKWRGMWTYNDLLTSACVISSFSKNESHTISHANGPILSHDYGIHDEITVWNYHPSKMHENGCPTQNHQMKAKLLYISNQQYGDQPTWIGSPHMEVWQIYLNRIGHINQFLVLLIHHYLYMGHMWEDVSHQSYCRHDTSIKKGIEVNNYYSCGQHSHHSQHML